MKTLHYITYILMFIGALNWGLVGLLNIDLVALIFGEMTILSKITYILVGFSALINIVLGSSVIKCDIRKPIVESSI